MPDCGIQNIFSPEWVLKNLLEETVKPSVEISVGPAMISQLRLIFGDVALFPTKTRLELKPLKATDDCLKRVETIALNAIRKLPHTPLRGYGVNFGFTCSSIDSDLFNAPDYPKLITEGLEPGERKIFRNLKIDNDCFVNLSISTDGSGDENVIEFNFHHNQQQDDMTLNIDAISNKALVYKNRALGIMENVYGVTINEEEPEVDEAEHKV